MNLKYTMLILFLTLLQVNSTILVSWPLSANGAKGELVVWDFAATLSAPAILSYHATVAP